MSSILINSYATFPKPLTIASAPVTKNLTVGQTSGFPYTIPLATAGVTQYGTPPYTWYIVSGSIPAGLTFTGSTGVISGSPTTVTASTPVVFGVRDVNGLVADVTQTITFSVVAAPSATNSTTAKNFTITQNNGATFIPIGSVTGGVTPYTYSIVSGSSSLIDTIGVAPLLYATSGSVILSNPMSATAGTYTVVFQVADSNGVPATSGTCSVTITVYARPTATAGTPTSESLTINVAMTSYSPLTGVSGGFGTLTYSASTALPTGITINSSGLVSGTPTAIYSSTNVTFTVTDSNGVSAATTQTTTFVVNNVYTLSIKGWRVTSGSLYMTCQTIDGGGNLIYAGYYVTGSTGTYVYHTFVAKYDRNNNKVWEVSSTTNNIPFRPTSVLVDSSNNIYLVGWGYTVGYPMMVRLSSAGAGLGYTTVATNYDNYGPGNASALNWSYLGGMLGGGGGKSVIIGSTIYMPQSGGSGGSNKAGHIEFSTSGSVLGQWNASGSDIGYGYSYATDGTYFYIARARLGYLYLEKYDSAGNNQWAKYYLFSSGTIYVSSVTATGSYVAVTGVIYNIPQNTYYYKFVSLFDSSGTHKWQTTWTRNTAGVYGGYTTYSGLTEPYDVIIDNSSNILVFAQEAASPGQADITKFNNATGNITYMKGINGGYAGGSFGEPYSPYLLSAKYDSTYDNVNIGGFYATTGSIIGGFGLYWPSGGGMPAGALPHTYTAGGNLINNITISDLTVTHTSGYTPTTTSYSPGTLHSGTTSFTVATGAVTFSADTTPATFVSL